MNPALRRARNRQMVIFLLACSGMLVLLGRLYYWQILEAHSGYNLAQLANEEHTQVFTLDAPRGIIYDSQGRILATNVVRDDVYIEPHQFSIDHPLDAQSARNSLIATLHRVLPQVSVASLQADFNTDMGAIRIAVKIDPAQSQALQNLRLPDVFLAPRTWRVYPGGTLAAQILGYVEQSDQSSTGVYGIEGQYNQLLSGTPGSWTVETDLQGNPLTVGINNQQVPVDGASITLTIDSNVEYMVETDLAKAVQENEAQSGTVVVLNAKTGAVVAMAGYPTFDPNNYGQYYNQMGCLHTEQVYFNPALYCAYEPGSTMKAVTMAAALDQGLITPDTTLQDNGCITYSDAPEVCNWEDLAYGKETMTQVLIHSANVGASYVAHNILGVDRYYPYLERFGFGQPTGIDGPEQAGSYRQPCGHGWSPCSSDWTMSDLTRQAFGQSIEATPIQVAQLYETIANGGVMMQPYLVASINNNGHITTTRPTVKRRVISQRAAQLLTGMLVQSAVQGFAQLAQVPGYSVAAKTGTATTQGISADQTEASVAGFLPASNPQFVILVKMDRPQKNIYGSTAAAPLWGQIAQQLVWDYGVPPDLKQ
ncbi:MAG TPA: penicillin-binding protein 2 [Ktedonobacteraceae bacterium]|jgi:cell division protein FtsI/penicillin-binding protein 2|nr:penicillin-binding protein 2 [Ktedonobacteraceae bacterium]